MSTELERELKGLANELAEGGVEREQLLHICEGLRAKAMSMGVPVTLGYALAHKLAFLVECRSMSLASEAGAPWRIGVRR